MTVYRDTQWVCKCAKIWASASDELALAAIEREARVLCAHAQNQGLH